MKASLFILLTLTSLMTSAFAFNGRLEEGDKITIKVTTQLNIPIDVSTASIKEPNSATEASNEPRSACFVILKQSSRFERHIDAEKTFETLFSYSKVNNGTYLNFQPTRSNSSIAYFQVYNPRFSGPLTIEAVKETLANECPALEIESFSPEELEGSASID